MRRMCKGTLKLKRSGGYLKLVGTEGSLGVVLAGEVVGEGGGSKVRRRTEGLGGVAAVGREAGGGGAVGALTAMEHLGEETVVVSASSQRVRAEMGLLAHESLEVALSLGLGALEHAPRVLHLDDMGETCAGRCT